MKFLSTARICFLSKTKNEIITELKKQQTRIHLVGQFFDLVRFPLAAGFAFGCFFFAYDLAFLAFLGTTSSGARSIIWNS